MNNCLNRQYQQLYPQMIRHTVLLKKNPQLHNAELVVSLPAIQDGEIVKITQHSHRIYVIYRLSQKMGQKQTEISSQLLSLNSIEQGECVVEIQRCSRVSHLNVKVSKLDWKIVNLKQMKVAMQFLQQVQVVWPKAKLPIYYDDCNFIVVQPQCEEVARLDVNTTLQFDQHEQQQPQSCQKVASDELQQELVHSGWCDISEGYANSVKISNKQLRALTGSVDQTLWIVENSIDYFNVGSIQQFSKLAKQERDKEAQKMNKKLVILSGQPEDSQQDGSYTCSKLSKQLLGLSDTLILSNSITYKPAFQLLSYPLFIKQSNYELTIEQVAPGEDLSQSYEKKEKYVRQMLAQKMASTFSKGKSFFILQEQYPFYLQNELYLLKLKNKKKESSSSHFYELKYVGSLNQQKINEIIGQLASNKIRFVGYRQAWTQSMLQKQYQHIAQWKTVLNTYKSNLISNLQLNQKQNTIILFSTIYEEQLIKIVNFVQSKSTHKAVCLVTSFGNNGKTFLHEVLESRQLKMWKINFRGLTNPQLTFQLISSYLHWVISNSPYDTIYFDDIDALCAKVEESDQHKKKEKIISKLITRKITQYLSIYGKKLIATAKSQAALEEQFPQTEIVVNLRNPTLQLRQKALRAIYVVSKLDDSPVRKLKSGIEVQKVKEADLIKVAEGTESLPFATFSKHAIRFSPPQTKKMSQKFDFTKLAGLQQAKKTIKNLIQKPLKYGSLFKSVPIKLPRGVLLYGSTGNGKTALGTSLKDEFKMKYFSVKGSDILSKYIGGSEAAVRDIFEKAMSVSPSIIFFDEFESIVPKRSANNTGVNDRIVNQFLCYLDGVSSTAGVYIVAASSRPDLIDPAVLRPGRLDAHLFLDYPSPAERGQLLQMFGQSVEISIAMQNLVQSTQNFSYSDLIGLMKELRIKRSAEVLKQENYQPKQFKKISKQLFQFTLANFKLSVQPKQQKNQRRIYQAFQKGSAPDIKNQKQMQQ